MPSNQLRPESPVSDCCSLCMYIHGWSVKVGVKEGHMMRMEHVAIHHIAIRSCVREGKKCI